MNGYPEAPKCYVEKGTITEFSAWRRLKRSDGQMWYPEWDAGTEKGDYYDKW